MPDEQSILSPALAAFLREEGYAEVAEIRPGFVVGLWRFLFTHAIVVGIDANGYRGRYCYEREAEAREALKAWDGEGDPPGNWIIYKGSPGEHIGPGGL